MEYVYRIKEHVAEFFVRRSKFLRRAIFSCDKRLAAVFEDGTAPKISGTRIGDASELGRFYVIVDGEKRKPRYFAGQWVAMKEGDETEPMIVDDAADAMYYMDDVAAEDTLGVLRNEGQYKVCAMPRYLDLQNTFEAQRFIIAMESVGGKFSYLRDWVEEEKKISYCMMSNKAKKMGFRECVALIDRLRACKKGYKYSMLHEIDGNVRANNLLDYLQVSRPQISVALSFML